MQSHAGGIHLLPALPTAWDRGEVKGLKARGGFEVDIKWSKGVMESAEVKSALGGLCVIISEWPLEIPGAKRVETPDSNPLMEPIASARPIVLGEGEAGISESKKYYMYQWETQRGQTYSIQPSL
ncbi:glycoside hydrolase family 95-like protein [Reichenbachiella ulvae]